MGARNKKTVIVEEVEKLIAEGWSFRVKKVKERKYISARKGKYEKGLGAHSEENWALINRLLRKGRIEAGVPAYEPFKVNDSSRPKGVMLFNEVREWFSAKRTGHKMSTCIFKGNDDFCTYWQWFVEPPIIVQDPSYPIRRKGTSNGDLGVWYLRATEYVCWDCPVFMDDRIVELIERRIAVRHGVLSTGKKE